MICWSMLMPVGVPAACGPEVRAPGISPERTSRVLVDAGSARRLARRVAREGLDMGSHCPYLFDPAIPTFRQVFNND